MDQPQAGAAYVKLAEWLENALTARENRHLQSAAEAKNIQEIKGWSNVRERHWMYTWQFNIGKPIGKWGFNEIE